MQVADPRRRGLVWRARATLLLPLLVAACSSLPPPAADPDPARAPAAAPLPEGGAADRLVAAARSRLASPYRTGGDDRRGFDCSGLTWRLFRQVGIALPRTAEAQAEAGRWVPLDELAGGDLVFFGQGQDKPHHVGLVVSEPGEPLTMIHASSSLGVVETVVPSSRYWLGRLRFGRRVLPAR